MSTLTVFGVSVSLERAALAALLLFTFLLPLGTRYIFLYGEIAGTALEWGSVSLFATQLVAAVFVALALFVRRRELSWRQSWPAVALALSVALSVAFSGEIFSAFLSTAWWIMLGLAVWLAVRLVRPDPRLALGALIASAAAQSALAAAQFGFQEVWASKWLGVARHSALIRGASVVDTADGRWLRAYGTLPHPNILGIYCAVGLNVAFWLVIREEGRIRKWAALSLPLITLGLVFSFSRSAWIGALFGLAVTTVVSLRKSSVRRRKVTAAALLAVFSVILGAVQVVPGPFFSRVTATGRLEDKSVSERVSAIRDARLLLAGSPFFGVGPGQMPHSVARLQPNREAWDYQPVHVLPIAVAVDVGVVGFLWWIVWLAWPWTEYLRRVNRLVFPFGPATIALSVMLVAGLFDHYAWTLWPGAALFFLLVGLSASEQDTR